MCLSPPLKLLSELLSSALNAYLTHFNWEATAAAVQFTKGVMRSEVGCDSYAMVCWQKMLCVCVCRGGEADFSPPLSFSCDASPPFLSYVGFSGFPLLFMFPRWDFGLLCVPDLSVYVKICE